MFKKNVFAAVLILLLGVPVSYAQESPAQGAAPQEGGRHTPPQAAIDACSGKSQGDDCSFTTRRGRDISGSCAQTKDGQTLFCKRARKTSS